LFGYKFKLMNRNFIQGHPYHLVEPSPYPLLVSLALLITTLSGVMTFHCYSNGAFLLSLLCFLSTVFAVTISLIGFRDLLSLAELPPRTFKFLLGLFPQLLIIVLFSVFILGIIFLISSYEFITHPCAPLTPYF